MDIPERSAVQPSSYRVEFELAEGGWILDPKEPQRFALHETAVAYAHRLYAAKPHRYECFDIIPTDETPTC